MACRCLHADAVDAGIRAETIGDLADPVEHLLLLEVDDVRGTGLAGERDTLRHRLDHYDLFRALDLGGFDREEADRSGAPDGDRLAALEIAMDGRLPACRQNVGEEQGVFVIHALRHLHGRDIGHGHAHVLGLTAPSSRQ